MQNVLVLEYFAKYLYLYLSILEKMYLYSYLYSAFLYVLVLEYIQLYSAPTLVDALSLEWLNGSQPNFKTRWRGGMARTLLKMGDVSLTVWQLSWKMAIIHKHEGWFAHLSEYRVHLATDAAHFPVYLSRFGFFSTKSESV